MFHGKRILLGIGGGIAVYRVAELARLLIKQGAEVRCVMTRSACEFVTPLTFEALTNEPVFTELFDLTLEREMGHIRLARWADVVVIAPVTSNLLAKLAHGIADDLLTTLMQVCDVPVLLSPAMNASMWGSNATQRNIALLKADGLHILEPASGELACGEQGIGRLPEPQAIAEAILPLITSQVLSGQHWVINAGPTIEPWDAVRVLSNRASGTLGSILANTAHLMGAQVSLIAGHGTPCSRFGVNRMDVQTADEMLQASILVAEGADVFIATAAVSDFRFADVSKKKIKRGDVQSMQVELLANPDIVAAIASMSDRPKKIIAFAAESDNHIEYAKTKLVKKGVDAIVANDVKNMASDVASGWWISKFSEEELAPCHKAQFAQQIIQKVLELNHE